MTVTPHSAAPPPMFTVIVAVYNAEKYLEETLVSLRRQSFQDFEVVMIDDGSRDGSASVASRFCTLDPRFRLYRTENRGISPARNLAVAHARAPWMAVCDADDTWDRRKLELQAQFIRGWNDPGEELVALGTSGHYLNSAGAVTRRIDLESRPWPAALRQESVVGHIAMINSSVVFRRDTFQQVGEYRAEYTPTEDMDLWVRLSERGAVLNLPQHLTGYRMHGSNISETAYVVMLLHTRRIIANAARRAEGRPEWSEPEFMEQLRRDPQHFAATMRNLEQLKYYNMGKSCWQNRRYLRAAGCILRSALADPWQTLRLLRRSEVYRSSRLVRKAS